MVDDICWHVVHAIHLALDYLAITAYIYIYIYVYILYVRVSS
jgi:hypothetical protein